MFKMGSVVHGALVRTVVLVCALLVTSSHCELLKNPGFESGVNDWSHDGFSMVTSSAEKHGGSVSVKCTGRSAKWQGPAQDVQITRAKQYVFTSYIKLLTDLPGVKYQTAQITIRFTLSDGKKIYFNVCQRKFFSAADGWTLLGGDFTVPDVAFTQAHLYVQGLLPHTDFYFDDASLTPISHDPNWQVKADQSIEVNRKSNLHVNVNLDAKFDPKDVTVQVNLLKHQFGWGSVVRSDLMTDPDYQQYQQVVYSMFNWATVGDYKWRYNRGTRENPDYTEAIAATDVLNSHGLKVRGHCMFWASPGHSPDWVEALKTGAEVEKAVDERLAYMTSQTKNMLAHWDVNNELVHGRFFEQATGDPHYTHKLFQKVHKADPTPTLMLNEFEVVSLGQVTQSYLSQINEFKAANVSLGAVGVQSHFNDPSYEPNPDVLKSRLDLLATAGLPIWVTELDMPAHNDTVRADRLEKVLRVYFGHPSVKGIILWGFWDHTMDPEKALVNGYGYELNEAGKRWMQLTKETWSTKMNKSLATATSFDIRGFKGDYEAVVLYRGQPIKRTTFTLGDSDKNLAISVNGDGHTITLPMATPSPFHVLTNPQHDTTQQRLHNIGSARSTSSSSQLQCINRISQVSQVGDDKAVEVGCQGDEVLTGCSSFSQAHEWRRDGEQIKIANGKPKCRAINGFSSTGGVQARARCCSLKSLSCSYRTAGPSGFGVDDQVEVPCQGGAFPTGCMAYTYASDSDGTLFTNTSCIAQNDDPQVGVFSYAACCSANHLQCTVVSSQPSGLLQNDRASVTCPSGYLMTGCNVFSQHGMAAGAFISNNNACIGINGSDKHGLESGVVAQATCCKV